MPADLLVLFLRAHELMLLGPNFRVVTLSDTGDRQLATVLENMLYIQSYTLSLMKVESQFEKSV